MISDYYRFIRSATFGRVIAKHEKAEWEKAKVLEKTDRGAGGFGHTGKK